MTATCAKPAYDISTEPTPLWAHQAAAVEQLAPLGSGMLAMDMGTGKTRSALELIRRWQCKRVLILCPKSVIRVWPAEFRKHLPGEVWSTLPLDGGTVAGRAADILTYAAMAQCDGTPLAVVLNYDVVARPPLAAKDGARGALASVDWDCLVLDEAHRVKAVNGQASKAVAQLAARIPHRLALTGTPMPHSPLDIYAQFRAIEPRVFGYRFAAFKDRYAVTKARRLRTGREYKKIVSYQHLDELQAKLAPRTFRVSSDDVLDLPETVDENRYVLLEPKAQRVYRDLEKHLVARIGEGVVTAANALAGLIRLAQVCNGFAPDVASGEQIQVGHEKDEALGELLADLSQDEPVVAFGRFHHDLDSIELVAAGQNRTCSELSGRCNELAAWQAGETNVLAVQLKAGGLGVDLTRARVQVYFALDYSLGDYLQTRKRIHRPGQTRSVTYIHLLAAGTVDEDVMAALAKRQEVVGAVVEGLKRR